MNSEREIAALYHENSRNYLSQLLYAPGSSYTATPSKRYASHPDDLYPDGGQQVLDLPRVMSTRQFADRPLERAELFALLHTSYRLQRTDSGIRSTTPSAGALYPLEVYVFIRHLRDARSGVYAYHREEGHLTYLRELNFDYLPEVNRFMQQAPALIVLTANLEQVTKKYGPRGYRYALIECGHLVQLLAMSAQVLGLGGCALGGFFDQTVDEILQLPAQEVPVYGYCVGHLAHTGGEAE